MQTFLSPPFSRSASTTTLTRREFPKPGKGRIEIDTRGGDDELHGGFIVRARNSCLTHETRLRMRSYRSPATGTK